MRDLEVYDKASRGPEGSLRFLFTRQTFASVASIGALITLLLLPIDAFTQQIVKPVSVQKPVSGVNSTFGYTTLYNTGNAPGANTLYDGT